MRTRVKLLLLGGLPVLLAATCSRDGADSAGDDDGRMIDVHAHIGEFKGYDLSEATLLAQTQSRDVRWTLVSNIDAADLPGITAGADEKTANERTVDFVRRNPDHFRGLYWVKPGSGDLTTAKTLLETTLSADDPSSVFVGLKFHPEMNQTPADDAAFDPYAALAQERGLPVVVHCGSPSSNSGADRVRTLATRHPKVTFVLYHMGFGGSGGATIEIAAKARSEGLKILLGTAQADPSDVLGAIKTLGSEAVLFGSDATYFGKDHYANYDALFEALASLPEEDRQAVLTTNARRVFALP